MKKLLFACLAITVLYTGGVYAAENNPVKMPAENDSIPEDGYNKWRFGGYGEMLLQRMDYSADRFTHAGGALKQNRAVISIPRAIFALDYKFNPKWILSTEVEFEYGGTGITREIEYDEAGEYETELEKGGEVVLEQFHITHRVSNAFQIRFGHMIVPVGITNAYHEPINFFGTTRPEGETTMIPSTWHETGISIFGHYKGLKYEAMVVNGLDPSGFSSAYWVRKGKQGLFEGDNMTSPAFVGRLEYSGIKNLRLGSSVYWGNTAKNGAISKKMKDINGEVTIFSGDIMYNSGAFVVRANGIYGNLSDSYAISKANKSLPKAAGYPKTSVAQNAIQYGIETGYDIFSLIGVKGKLYPFVRYEYYNTMEKTETGVVADPRYQRDLYTAGINYYPLPNLVIKADYSGRRLGKGDYNNENTFSVGAGYVVWIHKN